MLTIVDGIGVFKKCMGYAITRQEYEELPFREELIYTPIKGHLYKAKGEPDTVFYFHEWGGRYKWDAFPVVFIEEYQ